MRPISRPLRALVVILAAWGVGRGAALWHELGGAAPMTSSYRAPLHRLADKVSLTARSGGMPIAPASHAIWDQSGLATRATLPPHRQFGAGWTPSVATYHAIRNDLALRRDRGFGAEQAKAAASDVTRDQAGLARFEASGLNPASSTHPPHRLTVSAWTLLRATGASSLSESGQLGGSQAGLRTMYRLGRSGWSATARFSAPLGTAIGKEAAVGVAFKPFRRVPLTLIAEQRIAVDRGGRNDFELIATGGLYDKPLGHRWTLSGYAQAGVVGVAKRDAFIDGAAEVEHPFVHLGAARLSFGAGTWGAAQPSVARLDAGPMTALRFRLGPAAFKLEASYRLRLAGSARPVTGPAFSIGSDF